MQNQYTSFGGTFVDLTLGIITVQNYHACTTLFLFTKEQRLDYLLRNIESY